VIGREGLAVCLDGSRSVSVKRAPTRVSDGPRPDGASRRVRLPVARTGKACANASFTTETRTWLFDNGAALLAGVIGTRSARSQTDSGAENGKITRAINQYAAARAKSRQGDIFVAGSNGLEECTQERRHRISMVVLSRPRSFSNEFQTCDVLGLIALIRKLLQRCSDPRVVDSFVVQRPGNPTSFFRGETGRSFLSRTLFADQFRRGR